jgi:DNA-binding transcriptional regulator YdaS (Cro superfamily)
MWTAPDISIKIAIRQSGHTHQSLADSLGLTWLTVTQWVRKGVVPPARVPAVSAVTGIPMDQLNPDIFLPGLRQARRHI